MRRNTHNGRSEHYGELQKLVDDLFESKKELASIDLVIQAEMIDLCEDLLEICTLVPPGVYDRQSICDQMNSSLSGHGWGNVYGTVE